MNPLTNPFLFYSLITAFFAQVSLIYLPAFQWIFRTEPLTINEWAQILVVASTVLIAMEMDKAFRRKRQSQIR